MCIGLQLITQSACSTFHITIWLTSFFLLLLHPCPSMCPYPLHVLVIKEKFPSPLLLAYQRSKLILLRLIEIQNNLLFILSIVTFVCACVCLACIIIEKIYFVFERYILFFWKIYFFSAQFVITALRHLAITGGNNIEYSNKNIMVLGLDTTEGEGERIR